MRLTNSLLINRSVHKGQDTCKMGADHGRLKGRRRFLSFLEHNGDDIISNVALPFHLDVRINNITEVTQTWCIHRVEKLTQHHQPNQRPPSPELQAPLSSCLPCFPAPSPGSPLQPLCSSLNSGLQFLLPPLPQKPPNSPPGLHSLPFSSSDCVHFHSSSPKPGVRGPQTGETLHQNSLGMGLMYIIIYI